jgi:hypothetical protein
MNRSTPRATRAAGAFIALTCALLLVGSVHAGTICGTIRDGQTLQPVERAAVFLFDSDDAYTGLHAATDAAGRYCITEVLAGTYTVQVRVDDYLTAVVRDVVVEEATNVDVHTGSQFLLAAPRPNPARSEVFFEFAVPSGVGVALEVYDLRGRLVKGWKGDGGSDRRVRWDLRDREGNDVAAGTYFVRLRTDDTEIVQRFVRLR